MMRARLMLLMQVVELLVSFSFSLEVFGFFCTFGVSAYSLSMKLCTLTSPLILLQRQWRMALLQVICAQIG